MQTKEIAIATGVKAADCDTIVGQTNRRWRKAIDIEIRRGQDHVNNERERGALKEKILTDALDDAGAFYRQPAFVAIVTAILTSAALIGFTCAMTGGTCNVVGL